MNWKKLGRIILIVSIILIISGAAGFVIVSNALAATGCFPDTNGHWAETYICWLVEKGITGGYPDGTYKPERNVTRAEMAVFLQNTYNATAPNSGEIWIGTGHTSWTGYDDNDDSRWIRYSNLTRVYKATTGQLYIQQSPDLPTVLFGRKVRLIGVNFCYEGDAAAYVDQIWIRRVYSNYSTIDLFHDTTDRQDETCRRYNLSSPYTLGAYDSLVLFVDLQFNSAGSNFGLGETTWILEATDVDYPSTSPMEEGFKPEGAGSDGLAP